MPSARADSVHPPLSRSATEALAASEEVRRTSTPSGSSSVRATRTEDPWRRTTVPLPASDPTASPSGSSAPLVTVSVARAVKASPSQNPISRAQLWPNPASGERV